MGWIIGKGIGVPFRMGGGQSWSSYWSQQSEVLFFGLYSEISGGQMPNKIPGATDYLTVTGSAGSETYQCPNTAAYIAADTDHIWFKADFSQRTTTTAELIGYDFTRTIVKYTNAFPYSIEAIMIIASNVDTAKMRNDFDLSIWWSNVLSAYGNVKGNRGSEQSIWAPELVFTKLLSHFNGANGATAYSDIIAGAWTFVGTSVLSTVQKKFGTASLYCNTGKNYVSVPNSSDYNFGNGNFTIDCWVYPATLESSGSNFICGQADAAASAASRQSNICIKANTKKLQFFFWDSLGNTLSSTEGSTVFAINNFYHVAVVRNGNTITGYVNGVPECTLDVTGKTLQSSSEKFVIGSLGEYNSTSTNIRGYIDEFRISKGIARWIGDFSSSLPSSEYIAD